MVPPGGTAVVSVDPTPMQYGERHVAIDVRTDSPATPVVPLTLRIVGSQRPPFLLAVDGDLTFRDPVAGDSREVAITTIELEGSRESPEIRCDPPFLQITPIDVQEKPRLDDPGAVLKVARYRVEFGETPTQPFQGEVVVRDPWVTGRELALVTRVEVTPPLRAVPSRLVLRPGSKGSGETLHVFARGSASPEAITMEPASTGSPLRVEEADADREGGSRAFLVSWEEHSPLEEETHHLVIREPSGGYELTIPVRVDPGGAR